ncbi:hypothetical protein HYZ80_02710 [Candidatus Parcubacteria bacterium]|nr:hypothetical protein [Candidatus Parcubacteria bacterium]
MDRIEKALRKLSPKERVRVRHILERFQRKDVRGLDMQKLKARSDVFRVHKGDIRIIFRTKGDDIFVLAIERRSESTYRL